MLSLAAPVEAEIPAILFVVVPVVVFTLLLYLVRRARRRYLQSQAESWTPVDAAFIGSFELDENSGVASPNVLRSEAGNSEYIPRWATAIQYTYRVNGEIYAGTYFLPPTWSDGHLAAEAGRAWVGKQIVVRFNPERPEQSFFLERDGAPGKPHISRLLSDRPYVTGMSLK